MLDRILMWGVKKKKGGWEMEAVLDKFGLRLMCSLRSVSLVFWRAPCHLSLVKVTAWRKGVPDLLTERLGWKAHYTYSSHWLVFSLVVLGRFLSQSQKRNAARLLRFSLSVQSLRIAESRNMIAMTTAPRSPPFIKTGLFSAAFCWHWFGT